MIITIKTLKQKSFKVEIDESETVGALKKKIEEGEGSLYPAEGLKLIYSGKILSDASAISEYKIEESNFVVLIVNKVKPQPPKQVTPSVPGPPITPAVMTTSLGQSSATPQPTSASVISPPHAQATPTPAATPVSGDGAPLVPPSEPSGQESTDRGQGEATGTSWMNASDRLVTGSEYERTISELMSMGFDREHAVDAMTRSYNNPDRAADFLLSEIRGEFATPIDTETQQPEEQQPAVVEPVSEETGDENPLDFLRTEPHFIALRRRLQNEPDLLPTILRSIGQSNPSLLQLISQNQGQFISLLNTRQAPAQGQGPQVPPPEEMEAVGEQAMASGLVEAGGSGGQGASGPLAGNPMSISVTPQEKEAIDRLKEYGFAEHMVVQVYFACDKNEDMAMDILLNLDPSDNTDN